MLVSSAYLSAEVCLEDAEFEELTTIFTNLGNRLNEQQTTITNLESSLKLAQEAQGKLQLETETMSRTLNALKRSLDSQRQEAIKTTVIVSLVAALAGLIAGLLL